VGRSAASAGGAGPTAPDSVPGPPPPADPVPGPPPPTGRTTARPSSPVTTTVAEPSTAIASFWLVTGAPPSFTTAASRNGKRGGNSADGSARPVAASSWGRT